MELPETIDTINKRLNDTFGIDIVTGLPIWRVVWSEDQFEKRHGTFDDITPAGIYIRTVTEVREVPKYRQWIHEKYILERLVIIPEFQQKELANNKISYEPIWTFQDKDENYLPPKWDACEFIIQLIYSVQFGSDMSKMVDRYKDPDATPEEASHNSEKRIDGLVEELFGDQSSLGGSTVTGESIAMPTNYTKESVN